jgi:hypothetical protein
MSLHTTAMVASGSMKAPPQAAESVARIGPEAVSGGVERAGQALSVIRIEGEKVGLDERVDEEAAFQIGGVDTGLAAFDVELADELIVIESAGHHAPEHPEHQRVAFRPHPLLAEIDAALEIGHVEIAIEIVAIGAAIGQAAGAILLLESPLQQLVHLRHSARYSALL